MSPSQTSPTAPFICMPPTCTGLKYFVKPYPHTYPRMPGLSTISSLMKDDSQSAIASFIQALHNSTRLLRNSMYSCTRSDLPRSVTFRLNALHACRYLCTGIILLSALAATPMSWHILLIRNWNSLQAVERHACTRSCRGNCVLPGSTHATSGKSWLP